MKLTGKSVLSLPRVKQASFVFNNVVLDSLNTYYITLDEMSSSGDFGSTNIDISPTILTFSSGNIYGGNGQLISTYNTGEPFGFSGWIDTTIGPMYVQVDGVEYANTSFKQNENIGDLTIYIPNSGTILFDLTINTPQIQYQFSLPNYPAGGNVTGTLTTNYSILTYGISFQPYNSYEPLLSGINTGNYTSLASVPTGIVFKDVDSNLGGNPVYGVMDFQTLFGQIAIEISPYRYAPSQNITDFQLLDTGNLVFGNYFNGTWSGNTFTYQDQPSFITVNFQDTKIDPNGFDIPKNIICSISIPSTGTMMPANYVTGFVLTNSGQYLQVPSVQVNSYYYVTGLQQGNSTMLFSSGCTGNLNVTFFGAGLGTGASGLLLTHQVVFSGVYGNGLNKFYVVDSYSGLNSGTGYTIIPRMIVNTGQYPHCFDVPLVSGQAAWFMPATGLAAVVPAASYLTGTALCKTGIFGGNQTGYLVTGFLMTNPGSGYDSVLYKPTIQFVRQVGDSFTSNASGVFTMKTGSLNTATSWSVQTGIAGTTFGNFPFLSGTGLISLPFNQTAFGVQIGVSGLDITTGIPVIIQLFDIDGVAVNTTVTYAKNYITDTGYLKKNYSGDIVYSVGTLLGFTVSQSDLDTIYNTSSYTGNQSFSLGDLNF